MSGFYFYNATDSLLGRPPVLGHLPAQLTGLSTDVVCCRSCPVITCSLHVWTASMWSWVWAIWGGWQCPEGLPCHTCLGMAPRLPFSSFSSVLAPGLKAWQHSIHSMAQPALSSCGCGVLTLSNGGGLSSALPLSQMWESISPVVGNSDYLKFLLFAGHPDVRGSVSLWPCTSALSSHVCVVSPGSRARPCHWSWRDRSCLQAHGVGMATDSCSPVWWVSGRSQTTHLDIWNASWRRCAGQGPRN